MSTHSDPPAGDEFYIGWESRSAPGIAVVARNAVIALVVLAVMSALILASAQRMIGVSVFEWGTHRDFAGILRIEPYPHLLVQRPGRNAGFSSYHLVAPFKFGLDRDSLAALDGQFVSVKGTLIYRETQTMIETKPQWIRSAEGSVPPEAARQRIPLGRQTLAGEIVDSKCFLGVMNPGQLAPHRACAIRCISGGIPPVLLVRQKEGPPVYLLLVSAEGRPVNKQVLDLVAEPVEITGEVERQGELLFLRADPGTYRRLH